MNGSTKWWAATGIALLGIFMSLLSGWVNDRVTHLDAEQGSRIAVVESSYRSLDTRLTRIEDKLDRLIAEGRK